MKINTGTSRVSVLGSGYKYSSIVFGEGMAEGKLKVNMITLVPVIRRAGNVMLVLIHPKVSLNGAYFHLWNARL